MTVTLMDLLIIWGSCRILDCCLSLTHKLKPKKKVLVQEKLTQDDWLDGYSKESIQEDPKLNKVSHAIIEMLDSESHEVEMTVECTFCKSKKIVKSHNGTYKNIPRCKKDGMSMIPVRVLAKPKKK
jgi:hypothetical protein